MNKNNKFGFVMLSLLLLGLVVIIKGSYKEAKVVTFSIDSIYVEKVELAKKIIEAKKEYVYIDKMVKVNPVVYDLRLLNDNYDSEKTRVYFIKESLRDEYLSSICENLDIVIQESDFNDYKKNYSADVLRCKKDKIALFNGFNTFEDYIKSDDFKEEALSKIRYSKLELLSSDELAKYSNNYKNLELKSFSEIFDEEVDEMYRKSKNKNRY